MIILDIYDNIITEKARPWKYFHVKIAPYPGIEDYEKRDIFEILYPTPCPLAIDDIPEDILELERANIIKIVKTIDEYETTVMPPFSGTLEEYNRIMKKLDTWWSRASAKIQR